MGPGEMLQPIFQNGSYIPGPSVEIDEAHRAAVAHRGTWLFVLSSDNQLLLVKRSERMATCPSKLSIIGEHHVQRESDAQCAQRAVAEELPFFVSLRGMKLTPRTAEPARWFVYDYHDGRIDRCVEGVAWLEYMTCLIPPASFSSFMNDAVQVSDLRVGGAPSRDRDPRDRARNTRVSKTGRGDAHDLCAARVGNPSDAEQSEVLVMHISEL